MSVLFIIDLSLVIVIPLEIKIIGIMQQLGKQHDKSPPEIVGCNRVEYKRI